MRTILNLIWFFVAGIELFCLYIFFGVIACIFIITIPAGVACFRMANYVVWPFGRQVIDKPSAGAGSVLMNVIWFLVAGAWLAVGHVVTAFFLAVTIIGLPMAWANLKLIPVTCFPFGKQIVSTDQLGIVHP